LSKTKSFTIPKDLMVEAYKLVKANAGAAGVDQQSIADFDKNLKDNLYKIWNRMSSGTYFPPSVKAVPIPKKQGGTRILGVPTVSDRIAQMVVKLVFEPIVEPYFYPDSYGYRPNKSALDAVGVTRQRCWLYDWCLEFDIKGLFDNIDHELLLKAVRKHTDIKWVIIYIERWLKAPMQLPDGSLVERTKGTPQGGVISPVLSNLFLHYVFDSWMTKHHPKAPWCRYADDGLVHCRTEQEALHILAVLKERFEACRLELHPTKTKIVYCKDGRRKGQYPQTKFDFLGYTFRRRVVKNKKRNTLFLSFNPAVSNAALKSMRAETRKRRIRNRTELELSGIAEMYNPVLRGWVHYYGRYYPSALDPMLGHFNLTLVAWAMRKYKNLKGHKTKAANFLQEIAGREQGLFPHWKKGKVLRFA
jgi:RNA-directed DNA polymerase